MLGEYLDLQGFAVEAVTSGEDALAVIANREPDLVVLDLGLPGIDGFETLARLRKDHAVPVIMLTARGEDQDRIAGLLAGAAWHLTRSPSVTAISYCTANAARSWWISSR